MKSIQEVGSWCVWGVGSGSDKERGPALLLGAHLPNLGELEWKLRTMKTKASSGMVVLDGVGRKKALKDTEAFAGQRLCAGEAGPRGGQTAVRVDCLGGRETQRDRKRGRAETKWRDGFKGSRREEEDKAATADNRSENVLERTKPFSARFCSQKHRS